MNDSRRPVEIVVLSDLHLGTFGCHAEQILMYLQSIKPKRLILNGDIIDIWQFNKRYFPPSHVAVIKTILDFLSAGTQVDYVVGNHDEMLRRFVGLKMDNFQIVNKLLLDLDGKKTWIFHGDVFDVTMRYSKWLAKLGAVGYDTLIILNKAVNYCSEKLGGKKISLSRKIKNSVKAAVKFISDFEGTAVEIAAENNYATVICGHIHQPKMQEFVVHDTPVLYLNSGDWIENLTALEYSDKKWRLVEYNSLFNEQDKAVPMLSDMTIEQLLNDIAPAYNSGTRAKI